ncbi:MAG: hypothetical protein ACRDFB_03290 [Rhabdochlamydiaceae bacterium]
MAPSLDFNLKVFAAKAISTATTTLSDFSVDQQAAKRHSENGEPIGFSIFPTSLVIDSNETYEFQVVQADDGALTTNKEVIGTSGALTGTQVQAIANQNGQVFVGINPNVLTREFIGLQVVTVVNSGAISITIDAYLGMQSLASQVQFPAANYTP